MYRILSLDGYGAWSLLQVRALQELYGVDTRGREILSRFDLVAAHASGSIVAAALAADWPLSKILSLFLDEAARKTVITPSVPGRPASVSGFNTASRLTPGRRYEALVALLHPIGNLPLTELPETIQPQGLSPVHFLFVGFDSSEHRLALHRSDATSAARSLADRSDLRVVEAVCASGLLSSDPSEGPRRSERALCSLANPVMAAVTEALANGRPRDQIEILSLGTGNVCLPVSSGPEEEAPLYRVPVEVGSGFDGRSRAVALPDDAPDSSLFMAHVALGQPLPTVRASMPFESGSVVRMNAMIEPLSDGRGGVRVPDLSNAVYAPGLSSEAVFAGLVGMGAGGVEQQQVALIRTLAESWLCDRIHNQPIRGGASQCEVGHRWFSAAKQAWLSRDHLARRTRPSADRSRFPSPSGLIAERR